MKRTWFRVIPFMLVIAVLVVTTIGGLGLLSACKVAPRPDKFVPTPGTVSETTEPETPDVYTIAWSYYNAINNGDIEALASIFSDDIILCLPRITFNGKDDVLANQQRMIDRNARISFSDPETGATTFRGKHYHTDDAFDKLTGTISIEVRDGTIFIITIEWDEESKEKMVSMGKDFDSATPSETTQPETPDVYTVVWSYYDAINNGDIEALASLSAMIFYYPSHE